MRRDESLEQGDRVRLASTVKWIAVSYIWSEALWLL
jgi:hypothetical protein